MAANLKLKTTPAVMAAIDGDTLVNGMVCLTLDASTGLFTPYFLDMDSGAAESWPDIIAPTTNPGNKRWIAGGAYSGGGLTLSQMRVGGSGTPDALLHVYGSDARFRLQDDDDSGSYFEIDDASQIVARLNKVNSAGASYIDINPKVTDETSLSMIRFFRDTVTTGDKSLTLYKGDGSSTKHGQIGVDGADSFFQVGGGGFGVGTNNPNSFADFQKAGTTAYPFESAISGTYAVSPYNHEMQIKNTNEAGSETFTGLFFYAGAATGGGSQNTARISAIKDASTAQLTHLGFGCRKADGEFEEIMRISGNKTVSINGLLTPNVVHYLTNGADVTVDCSENNVVTINCSYQAGSPAMTFDLEDCVDGQEITVAVEGGGDYTVTWKKDGSASDVIWDGGTAPTLETGSNKSIVKFVALYMNGSLKLYGKLEYASL